MSEVSHIAQVHDVPELMCTICQEGIDLLGDNWSQLPCSHAFHIDCLDGWITAGDGANRGNCPNCLAAIPCVRMVGAYERNHRIPDALLAVRAQNAPPNVLLRIAAITPPPPPGQNIQNDDDDDDDLPPPGAGDYDDDPGVFFGVGPMEL